MAGQRSLPLCAILALAWLQCLPCLPAAAHRDSVASFAPVTCPSSLGAQVAGARICSRTGRPAPAFFCRRLARRGPGVLAGAAEPGQGGSGGGDDEEIRAFLQGLKRADLQSLAKASNIPANQKSSEIIEKLVLVRHSLDISFVPATGEAIPGVLRVEDGDDEEGNEEEQKISAERDDEQSDWIAEDDEVEVQDEHDAIGNDNEITEAAVELSSQLGGLGAIVVYPTEGDFELELPLMAAQFGAQREFTGGTLHADEMVFFPPHVPGGESEGDINGQVAVMQRGGGLTFVKKALIAQVVTAEQKLQPGASGCDRMRCDRVVRWKIVGKEMDT